MNAIGRLFAIIFVFAGASVAWLTLGGITKDRSRTQSARLSQSVSELWGTPQEQSAPEFLLQYETQREVVREEEVDGKRRIFREVVTDQHSDPMSPSATDIDVDLVLDQRLKGLVWYSLYDVAFSGVWSYVHKSDIAGTLLIRFAFPGDAGIFDEFRFALNGQALELTPREGWVETRVPIQRGDELSLEIGYESRGMDRWTYRPAPHATRLEAFSLAMRTDFADIDFPAGSLSPSSKEKTEDGFELGWTFSEAITGRTIGMVMPQRIQPGELASSMAFSAPVSLLLFFIMIWSLATLRAIEIHPINYFFLAAAFFAFHLLFAYTVDRVDIITGFVIASLTSVFLVVSYLRLVVSGRFAYVEAAIAQLVYLVGFSLAHFFEGLTGLVVTVLSITTLFVLMQLTGRVRWSQALASKPAQEGEMTASA